jgi:hypothetical protein
MRLPQLCRAVLAIRFPLRQFSAHDARGLLILVLIFSAAEADAGTDDKRGEKANARNMRICGTAPS